LQERGGNRADEIVEDKTDDVEESEETGKCTRRSKNKDKNKKETRYYIAGRGS
jgi:hypothetical protein